MLDLLKCKCLIGFLWTSAIAAGLLAFIFFSFIDPTAIAGLMNMSQDTAIIEAKVYLAVFVFFWMTMNTTTYLAFYLGQLLKKMAMEEKSADLGELVTHIETGASD